MRDQDFIDRFGYSGHICYLGGSSPAGNTNTIQSSTPWAAQQPALASIYQQAGLDETTAVPQYYPGDTYSGLTNQQTGLMSNLITDTSAGGDTALQGANSTLSNTLSPGYTSATSGTFGSANNVLGNELSSSYLNPENSPTYATAISNAEAQALPSATSSFVNGNRSDSGLAQAASTSAATNAAAGLAQQQYNTNLGIQNQAASTASNNLLTQEGQQNQASFYAPMVDQAQTNDLTTGLNVAGMNQTNNQNQLNANIAAYNYGQMLPWNDLSLYEGAITGTGSPGGSSTTSQPYFDNPTANALSGVTAAGMGVAGASALAQGAGYSGLFLGATPLLSDRRAKTDIRKIGESDSGFPLYSFRYKGETPMAVHIGVMAQDVEKEKPEAIVHTPSGLMMVDYAKALAA